MAKFERYCGWCHECGTVLMEFNGEDWCPTCNTYRYYFSHGKHQSMYDGDYDTQVDNSENCPERNKT